MTKRKFVTSALFAITLLAIASTTAFAAAIKPFKAASVQFNPVLHERDKNIDGLAKAVEEAAKNGAKLIVCPEMSTTGYQYKDRDEIAPYTDTIPGKATDVIGAVAKKYGAYVVFGMAERDPETDLFYNAAAFVGPKGYIGKYRKSHQWEAEEHWAVWGDVGVPVHDTELGKIGIIICMDANYVETARLAALGGADILAFPTDSTAQALWALQSRAILNGYYIVCANRSNTELDYHALGGSAIWSPTGQKLVSAKVLVDKDDNMDAPNIYYAMIDPAEYNNVNKQRLAQRRPKLYKDLALHIAPWNYQASTKSQNVNAAIVQYAPVKADKKQNMAKIEKLLADRKSKLLDYIVLPEFSLTGRPSDANEAKSFAEKDNGASITFFKELAKKNSSHVVGTAIEDVNDKLFITAYVIAPDGKIIGKYAKTHLNDGETWASAGDKVCVFETSKGKLGVVFGNEAMFPEMAGVMAVKRADMLAVPASWNGEYGANIAKDYKMSANPYPENAMCVFDALGLTSQAYTMVANFTGESFKGGSGKYALDPLYGLDKVELLDKEETAFCVNFDTLHLEWWFNQEKLIGGRNPHMYKPIIMEK